MSLGVIKNVVRRQVGDRVYFFGCLSSDRAKNCTYVPVVEESATFLTQDATEGYQRPGTKPRMNKFKRYLIDYPNRLTPPVILSARGSWAFEPTSGNNESGQLVLNGPAAIVDGQHRIGGIVAHFEETEEVINFDFICFENLSREEEIEEFTTINGMQVGVPKALQAYLDGAEESSIAWELNTREDSPFFGKISHTRMKPDQLFMLHSVAKNVKRSFAHGSLEDLPEDEKTEALIYYWNAIKETNATQWKDIELPRKDHQFKLLELTGNIAWSIVAHQILLKGFAPQTKTFNWDEIQKVVNFVSEDVDWEKQGDFFGLTGEVGGKLIAKHLERALGYYGN